MGNLVGFTKKGKVSVRHVWKALHEVLDVRFPECFDALPLLGTGIHVICRGCPDLQWEWWQDGNRVWGKYPHYGEVGYWAHGVILEDVGSRIDCRLTSEGDTGTWKPDTSRYLPFRDYFKVKNNYGHSGNEAALAFIWADVVTQIPPALLPFAGDTGPL